MQCILSHSYDIYPTPTNMVNESSKKKKMSVYNSLAYWNFGSYQMTISITTVVEVIHNPKGLEICIKILLGYYLQKKW